jgi:hypothetical protein
MSEKRMRDKWVIEVIQVRKNKRKERENKQMNWNRIKEIRKEKRKGKRKFGSHLLDVLRYHLT